MVVYVQVRNNGWLVSKTKTTKINHTHTKKKKKTDLPALENSCHFPRGKHGPAKKKKIIKKRTSTSPLFGQPDMLIGFLHFIIRELSLL